MLIKLRHVMVSGAIAITTHASAVDDMKRMHGAPVQRLEGNPFALLVESTADSINPSRKVTITSKSTQQITRTLRTRTKAKKPPSTEPVAQTTLPETVELPAPIVNAPLAPQIAITAPQFIARSFVDGEQIIYLALGDQVFEASLNAVLGGLCTVIQINKQFIDCREMRSSSILRTQIPDSP